MEKNQNENKEEVHEQIRSEMNVVSTATASGQWEVKPMTVGQEKKNQFFYGRGKLLLTGEYIVLDGAQSLAVPLKVGQSMSVSYSPSFEPVLHWKSFDVEGKLWLEAKFEFWRFNILDENPAPEVLDLQTILRQARKQNSHFLRDEVDVNVETHLGFPLNWGLGSSSTLIYNVAQWAYVSPFELQFKTMGGSGYDVACAQCDGPILYTKNNSGPHWSPTLFSPVFKDKLYFIYLGQKQNSRKAVARYSECKERVDQQLIQEITEITKLMAECQDFKFFEGLLTRHEALIGHVLGVPPIKAKSFSDYWGEVKSLGAWGGDFALVTSDRSEEETQAYFTTKGIDVFLHYTDLVHFEGDHDQVKGENELYH